MLTSTALTGFPEGTWQPPHTTDDDSMSPSSDTSPQSTWVNKATTFLEYGYPIVPLKPSFGVSNETEDPVVEQLGAEPLVNRITGAATTAQEIQKLGKLHEEARIATVTGVGVDLLAVELNKTAGREQDPFWNEIRSHGKAFAGVKSTTREYIFFASPALKKPLPSLTRKEGVVLHGEDSLVYLPGSLYEWRGRDLGIDQPPPGQEEKIGRAQSILKLFDRGDHLTSRVENGGGGSPRSDYRASLPGRQDEPAVQGVSQTEEKASSRHSHAGHSVNGNGHRENGHATTGKGGPKRSDNGQPSSTPNTPAQGGSRNGTGPNEEASRMGQAADGPAKDGSGSLSSNGETATTPESAGKSRSQVPKDEQISPYRFRTGEELTTSENETSRRLNLPWTVPGGLSVMTGRPKVSGKSSWVTNLALHLSAGRAFLGYDTSEADVILMADMPPPSFQEAIGQVGTPGREEALAHLHVLHPTDVSRLDWVSTIDCAYGYAEEVGADLIIIDCIDRYVSLKGGERPTENESVAHKLSADAPPECPILGVKSTGCAPGEPFSKTIDRLGMLGTVADAILRLDNISTNTFPSLRRLSTASRHGAICRTHLCSLQSGRYVRVTRSDLMGLSEHELLGGPPIQNSAAENHSRTDSQFKTNGA